MQRAVLLDAVRPVGSQSAATSSLLGSSMMEVKPAAMMEVKPAAVGSGGRD